MDEENVPQHQQRPRLSTVLLITGFALGILLWLIVAYAALGWVFINVARLLFSALRSF